MANMTFWGRALAGLVLTVTAACSTPEPPQGPPSDSPSCPTPAPLQFDLIDLDRRPARLDDFRGRVVVFDFWATWCGPCLVEIPDNKKLAERLRLRGAELVGVVFDSGDREDVRDFVNDHAIGYRQLMGTEDMFEAWSAKGLPTTYVVGADGALRGKIEGALPHKFQEIDTLVDAAIAAKDR